MLIAETRGRQTPIPGETISLGADLSDVHVFDENGRRLDLAAA